MDEHLTMAQFWMEEAKDRALHETAESAYFQAIWQILRHLESQLSQEAPQPSEKPSSEVFMTGEGVSSTSPISRRWSFPVSPDGPFWPSVLPVISAWCNSVLIAGSVQEVEIGVTLTSKASTLPDGLRSPLTGGPVLEGNGHAGVMAHDSL